MGGKPRSSNTNTHRINKSIQLYIIHVLLLCIYYINCVTDDCGYPFLYQFLGWGPCMPCKYSCDSMCSQICSCLWCHYADHKSLSPLVAYISTIIIGGTEVNYNSKCDNENTNIYAYVLMQLRILAKLHMF